MFDSTNTNIAQQGSATQSSYNDSLYPASNAINGNMNDHTHTREEQGENQTDIFKMDGVTSVSDTLF